MSILDTLSSGGLEAIGRYYSIYQGIVIDNQDPTGVNRLKVVCANILGGITFWASPRNQYGGNNEGFKYLPPAINDVVYITFMDGDLSNPLWEYRGWFNGKASPMLSDPNVMGFSTRGNNFTTLDDETGDIYTCFQGNGIHIYGGNNQIQAKGIQQIDGKDGLILAGGENGGLIIIAKLTEKINQLVREIEGLKAQINTHTHSTSQGPTTPPVAPITQTITPFNQTDYEDNHTIH